jgi:uncharacterized protein YndB with AHSA1/START domain
MSFDKTVFLPLDPKTVFELITQPERLRRWKTVAARVDLRIGGQYRWTITPGHSAMGTFSQIEPGKSLHFTWGWQGDTELPPGASTVSITVDAVEGGTSLRLVHGDLTPDQEKGHAEGWNHYLDRLVEFATIGQVADDPWSVDPNPVDEFTCAETAVVIIQRALRTLTSADLLKVTPYKQMTVREVLDHLRRHLELIESPTATAKMNSDAINPEVEFADLAQSTLEFFRASRPQTMIKIGSALLPPTGVVANILTLDFLIHALDIAMVTNQKIDISPILIQYIVQKLEQDIPLYFLQHEDSCEPEFISESPGNLERLIAYTGQKISTR